MNAILTRLREPSTWAGLSALSGILALFGLHIPAVVFHVGPDLVDLLQQLFAGFGVVSAGAAVALPEVGG